MRSISSHEVQSIVGGQSPSQGAAKTAIRHHCKPWEEIAHSIASLLYDISFSMLLHSKIRKKYDSYND